jgi:hypothetical protein
MPRYVMPYPLHYCIHECWYSLLAPYAFLPLFLKASSVSICTQSDRQRDLYMVDIQVMFILIFPGPEYQQKAVAQ